MDPAFLDQSFLGLSVLRWGEMLGLWLVIAVVLFLIRRIFFSRLSALAERTKNRLDGIVAEVLKGTRSFFIILLALYLSVEILLEDAPAIPIILQIVFLGLLFQVGLWGNDLIALSARRYAESNGDEAKARVTAVKAISLFGKLILWSLMMLLALDNFGIDITALVAGLGIGSIAIALAVQNILQDMSGLYLHHLRSTVRLRRLFGDGRLFRHRRARWTKDDAYSQPFG